MLKYTRTLSEFFRCIRQYSEAFIILASALESFVGFGGILSQVELDSKLQQDFYKTNWVVLDSGSE